MPIKDTPWGQTKVGVDEDGTRRPPRPGFLPPAPPPCSVSPIPSRFQGLASSAKSVSNISTPEKCDSAVYESVKEREVKSNQNSTMTNGNSNNDNISSCNGYEETTNTNLNSTNGESAISDEANGINIVSYSTNGNVKSGNKIEESEEEDESSYEYYDTSSEEEEEENDEDNASDEPEKELDKVLVQNEIQQGAYSGTDEYEEDDEDEWEYEDEDEEYEEEEEGVKAVVDWKENKQNENEIEGYEEREEEEVCIETMNEDKEDDLEDTEECHEGSDSANNIDDNIQGVKISETTLDSNDVEKHSLSYSNTTEKDNESECLNAPTETENSESLSSRVSAEKVSAMPRKSPAIPSFVSTPEPCNFFDDPATWIKWMEKEVNDYKAKKAKEEEMQKREEEEKLLKEKEEQEAMRKEREKKDISEKELKEKQQKAEIQKNLEDDIRQQLIEAEKDNNLSDRIETNVTLSRNVESNSEDGNYPGNNSDITYSVNISEEDRNNSSTIDAVIESPENTEDNIMQGQNKNEDESGKQEEVEDADEDDWEWDEGEEEEDTPTKEESKHEDDIEKSTSLLIPKLEVTETSDNQKNDEESDVALENKDESKPTLTPSNKEERDPMEVLEKMKQLKKLKMQKKIDSLQNRPASSQEVTCPETSEPPSFVRQQSNPEGNNKKSRPFSCYDQNDSHFDDMLGRIQKLREERKQILEDMSNMKNAFCDDENTNKEIACESKDLDGTPHASEIIAEDEENIGDHTEISTPNSMEGISNNSIGTNSDISKTHTKHSRLPSIDSGFGTVKSNLTDGDENCSVIIPSRKSSNTKTKRRKRSDQHSSAGESTTSGNGESIYCFICGMELGLSKSGRLSKGAVMHMGLSDGDPICPDAIYLTESSMDKIRSIVKLSNFNTRAKYDMLETLDLEMYDDEEYDSNSKDVLSRVENFLEDVEMQKEKDKEKFDAIRSGAIDEIFAAEYGEFYENSTHLSSIATSASASQTGDNSVYTNNAFDDGDCITEAYNGSSDEEIPPPPLPEPAFGEKSSSARLPSNIKELDAELKAAIQKGKKLKRTYNRSDSSDPVGAGKVLHRHIAPRVFTSEVRNLMHDIARHGGVNPDDSKDESRKDKKKRKLKKVSTRDKSAPYIPKDIEIYFYAGPNKKEDKDHTNKSLPPLPPVSRTLPNAKEETVKEIQPKAPTFGEAGTYFGESSVPTKTKSR